MAQSFVDFDDYPAGSDVSDFFTPVWGSYDYLQVVDIPSDNRPGQSDELGNKALRAIGLTNLWARRALKYEMINGSENDEIYAVVGSNDAHLTTTIITLTLRGGGTSEATRTGYQVWIRSGVGNFEIRKKLSGVSSTLASVTTPSNLWDSAPIVWFTASAQGSSVSLQVKLWSGVNNTEYTLSATDNSPLPVGWMAISHVRGEPMFVGAVGFGTDGDPAPTGFVEVSAEPFALRHNPRTNKVIPVLSSPTVTDIGANCVRPRVTKGY